MWLLYLALNVHSARPIYVSVALFVVDTEEAWCLIEDVCHVYIAISNRNSER